MEVSEPESFAASAVLVATEESFGELPHVKVPC